MDSSLALFRQVLRKLCLFKPWQSREPLPGHCCTKAMSRVNAHSNCHISQLTPPIEIFLSILESPPHKLRIAHGLILVTPNSVGGRHSQHLGPSPTLGSLGPSHQRHHKSRVLLQGPLCAHVVSGAPHGEVRDNVSLLVRHVAVVQALYLLSNTRTYHRN